MKKSREPKSPVDAVQLVYGALEPFDEQARRRIVESAASLLGMRLGPMGSEPPVRGAQPPVTHGTISQPTAAASAARPLSPVELIQEKQPTTNAQKIALFAYYREKVEGLSRFSRSDLEGYFAKARQPPPGNFNRDFQAAVNLGWIHEDGDDSYLTTKGLEAVEAGFGGKAQPRGRTAVNGRRKGRVRRVGRPRKSVARGRKQKRS
jgi:hypothetical protein